MKRSKTDLLALAGQYANDRRIPAATVVKEILHYEILYAMVQSGAAPQLAFQGGTALRLCYQGTRYSEDLDFAGGETFDPETMAGFSQILEAEIAAAYGLQVDIKPPKQKDSDSGVSVARWSARVQIPQLDRSAPQKQVINIEVAAVPAHDIDLVPVVANYPHLPAPFRQMLVSSETQREILADKIIALGARDFLKARDIWDIKFLTDRQIALDMSLVSKKLVDYGWSVDDFKGKLETRLAELDTPETAKAFHQEMSRFVDASVATQLANPKMASIYLRRAKDLGQSVIDANPSPARRFRP